MAFTPEGRLLNALHVAGSYVASVRTSGLRDATAALYNRCYERLCEYRLGIATSEWHELLDPARPDFRGYAPTAYRDWRLICRHLIVGELCTLVDYGAGLGRVTALAAQLPFRRVIGVELNQDLADRGNANLRVACRLIVAWAEGTTFYA